MITALDHVQLAAPPGTEDLLRAYYADVLGMTEIPKPPALAARGGCWFAGRQPCSSTSASSATSGPRRRPTPGSASPASRRFAARARRPRAPRSPGTTPSPATGASTAEDPVGNRLEFLEPVIRCGIGARR